MPRFPKTVEITQFSGLNNVLSPERTPPHFLKVAENIDVDKSGGIHKRPGYQLVLSGSFHSVWGEKNNFLAVKDNYLVRINDDFSTTTLSTYNHDARVSYTSVDYSNDVYFVSQDMQGYIVGNSVRPFGYIAPQVPILTEVAGDGNLTAGIYHVSLTYVSDIGEESGSRRAEEISISSGSTITVSNIRASNENNITKIRIYCSTPNGETLYLVGEIPNSDGSFSIGDVHTTGVTPLKSFNMYPAPKGDIIRYYRGRMWIADDKVLWYSSPFSFNWWNLQSDYFTFESNITEVMPVTDGIWVGTEKGLYYLSGKVPEKMILSNPESVSVVKNTGQKISGAYIFIDNTPIGYKWLVTTNKGIFVCFNDGITLNTTERNVVFPTAEKGVSTFVQQDGINRYLTLLEEKKPSNNAVASDIVTATVIRNGVVI